MASETKDKGVAEDKGFGLRRLIWALIGVIFLLLLLAFAARIFVMTKAGHNFIEAQINKRSFGPIERVEITGLSGDPLKDLGVQSLKIYDKDGLWAAGENLSVKWNPWTLRRKVLDLQSITLASAEIMRKPKLNSSQSNEKSGLTIELDKASIKALTLDEAVLGRAATFALLGGFKTAKDGAIDAEIDAQRTDAAGDKLHLVFNQGASGEMLGDFELTGAPGGVISALIQAPAQSVITGTGKIGGAVEAGSGDIAVSFDGAPKITARGDWSQSAVNLTAQVQTVGWPLFKALRTGLGDSVDAQVSLDRSLDPLGYDLDISSSQMKASANGQLGPDGGLPETAEFSAQSYNLGALLPLPDGFALGSGQVSGEVKVRGALAPNYAFSGDVNLTDIQTPYGTASSIGGPLQLAQRSADEYLIDGDLAASNLALEMDLPIILSAKTNLKAKALLNTRLSSLKDLTLELVSGGNEIHMAGDGNYAAQQFGLTGKAQLALSAMGALPAGSFQADYAVSSAAELPAMITASGAFRPDDVIASPFDQILQSGLNFDVALAALQGGFEITKAALIGEAVRAALSGHITDQLDIAGEAVLIAPLAYDSAELLGETAASFTLTGARDDPDLRLDARSEQIKIGGYDLTALRLRADIGGILAAPKGPIRFTGETPLGALDVSADFMARDQIYSAEKVAVSWGPMTASGHISKPITAPASGQFNLNLPEMGNQYAKVELKLSPQTVNGITEQGMSLNADAANIIYSNFAFDSFTASIDGSISKLTGRVDANGWRQLEILQRKVDLTMPITVLRQANGAYQASIDPEMNYGSVELEAARPVTASYKSGDIRLDAPFILAEKPVNIHYSRLSGKEDFSFKADELPMALFPMPGYLADTRSHMSVDIKLASTELGDGMTGGGDVGLQDWRRFDAPDGSGLSGDVKINLSGPRLGWQLSASSPGGFQANSTGGIAIKQASELIKIRPNMTAPLSGKFTASGDGAAVLGLVAPNASNPGGMLKADLDLFGTLTGPLIEGQVSGQDLHMETLVLGTQLRQGRFTADFTNNSLAVNDVMISDAAQGNLSGQGAFKIAEFGQLVGSLQLGADNFQLLDRNDYSARVSGNLEYASERDKTKLTGEVTIKQAEITEFVSGKAHVVEIPVEEINRPKKLHVIEKKGAGETEDEAAALPMHVDVKVKAPRRIFVRTLGLDVELSMDASIKGLVSAPEIIGDASVVRGGYKVAGKDIEFESGSIEFNGSLEAAKVNLIATADTPSLSAQARITGTLGDPELELSSTPDRPPSEILSALLFGRSAADLLAVEAAQLAGALVQFSGGGGGFNLMGGLRDALDLGDLSIGFTEDGEAQISGGRYIVKNVYLEVFSGGIDAQPGAAIDWEIRRNISLRSTILADNDQSFSLKWRRDF